MIKKEWLSEDIDKVEYERKRQIANSEEVYLCTTRFSNDTYYQNKIARLRLKKKCIYSNSIPLSNTIRHDAPVFVLELNNSENKIMGIGCIRNIWNPEVYRVYENDFYNQPYFEGNYYICRERMNTKEEELMKSLDNICFHGKTHLKRGHNMIQFPAKTMKQCEKHGVCIITHIKTMFELRYGNAYM
jgi:hypothetical protein